jgi:hypothetical protein
MSRKILLVMCLLSAAGYASPHLAIAQSPLPGTAGGGTKAATQPEQTPQFLRFVEDRNGGGKLEAAIVTYKNADGVTVHLVSALHVAEKSFYDGLQKDFSKYDVLLYEMVKMKDAPPPQPGERSNSAVSSFQRFLKNSLDLDFQLDDIDYTKSNFVNADLDYETFSRLQDERGESIMGIMLQSMLREWRRQLEGEGQQGPQPGMLELLVALKAPDRSRQLKLLLARQFDNIEDQMAGLTGPNGSVIITERNKAAMAGLKTAMADGKKNIGIFYGAGHMRDMEQRVLAMGFHPVSIEWRVGWDMTIKPGDPATKPTTRALFENAMP